MEIRHKVMIRAAPEKVYRALTDGDELANWPTNDTTAKPEIGFVGIFLFGKFRNEIKVSKLNKNKTVEWQCINSIEEWIETEISFELEGNNYNTHLRFTHRGWRALTNTFASCNYDCALSIRSLKSLCETETGTPYQNK